MDIDFTDLSAEELNQVFVDCANETSRRATLTQVPGNIEFEISQYHDAGGDIQILKDTLVSYLDGLISSS